MAKKKTQLIPVTERALVGRIQRKLQQRGEKLKKCPQNSRWHNQLGNYYVVDVYRNSIECTDQDLAKLGTELGCLKPYETLAE